MWTTIAPWWMTVRVKTHFRTPQNGSDQKILGIFCFCLASHRIKKETDRGVAIYSDLVKSFFSFRVLWSVSSFHVVVFWFSLSHCAPQITSFSELVRHSLYFLNLCILFAKQISCILCGVTSVLSVEYHTSFWLLPLQTNVIIYSFYMCVFHYLMVYIALIFLCISNFNNLLIWSWVPEIRWPIQYCVIEEVSWIVRWLNGD